MKSVFKTLYLSILICCLSTSCNQTSKSENLPLVTDKFEVNKIPEDQILFDSIKYLVNKDNWHAAHSAIIQFKLSHPGSPLLEKVKQITTEIRKQVYANPKNGLQIENPNYEKITNKLRKETDELKKRTFFHAKEATPYINEDAVLLYLDIPFRTPYSPILHFSVQNVSKLNYQLQYVQFAIDGINYPYLPTETFTNKAHQYHWQWFDDEVKEDVVFDLVKKLSTAKKAMITLYFQQDYKWERTISKQEKNTLKEILIAYDKITTISNQ